MITYYYILFAIFTILAVMIVVDANVGDYIILILKSIQVNFERLWWMFVNHPSNFVTTWVRNRKYDKIARELEEEFRKRQ